ncbi:MAG TPA: fatty acid hydroxylase [Methylomirabilota bacterium]|nr:fatty acid hydroxylase [Methylomirabilota bacterium]
MESIWFWSALGFGGAVLFASLFEWTLHRYFMHQPVGPFDYAFRTHALVHHQVFKADHTYHLIHERDKETITMAWWNGPLLIALCMVPALALAWILHRWSLACGALLAFITYYVAYEYMHWCMHLPKSRRVERSWLFRRLNGHHLLHHRYMHKNFNVVLPLADLCFGTLLLRSKIHFPQVRGASVPDVQPRVPRQIPSV